MRSWDFWTRGIRSETSTAALDSDGGTPEACSDRIETTAIRSAVADLPIGQILRVWGVLVETWEGKVGRQQILMVKLMVKSQGPKKSAFPTFFEKSEGTF